MVRITINFSFEGTYEELKAKVVALDSALDEIPIDISNVSPLDVVQMWSDGAIECTIEGQEWEEN